MKLTLLLCIILLPIAAAPAADITLAWDPSPSEGIAGYRLYIGKASGVYWTPIRLGTGLTYTVSGLGPGKYFFAVTAFNLAGNESGYSNEVSDIIPDPAFAITSTSVSRRWFGVVIQCTTSLKSSAILRYQEIREGAGTTAVVVTIGATKTKHQAVLYLPAGQAWYRYEWEVISAAGTVVKSGSTFMTQ